MVGFYFLFVKIRVSRGADSQCAVFFVVLVSLVTVGCRSTKDLTATMIPSPVVFTQSSVELAKELAIEKSSPSVEIFYACDHGPEGGSGLKLYKRGVRCQLLRVGTATVQLGEDGISWEKLSAMTRLEQRPEESMSRIVGLDEYGVLDAASPPGIAFGGGENEVQIADLRFANKINASLAKSTRKNINVYVHGFNTQMNSHLNIVGQLHYFSGMDGVSISYNWPSQVQLFNGYHADKANARFSVRHFRLLLEFLAAKTDVKEINILAHSAGCPIVVESLRLVSFQHSGSSAASIQRKSKIGSVILGAPDGDLDWFVNAVWDGWMKTAKNVDVYSSKVDRALKISSKIFEAPRTGGAVAMLNKDQLKSLRNFGNLRLIDATSAKSHNSLITRHQYHYMNAWVSSDVLLALNLGLSPIQRGLTLDSSGVYWSFSEDYEERLKALKGRF